MPPHAARPLVPGSSLIPDWQRKGDFFSCACMTEDEEMGKAAINAAEQGQYREVRDKIGCAPSFEKKVGKLYTPSFKKWREYYFVASCLVFCAHVHIQYC